MVEKNTLPLTPSERRSEKSINIVRAATRIVLCCLEDNKMVYLTVEHPEKGMEFPGGAIDPDELPVEAAKRELKEEAGIDLPDKYAPELITMRPLNDKKGGDWLDIFYYAFIDNPADVVQELPYEFPISWVEVNEMPPSMAEVVTLTQAK